jgi:hypothetical protein
MSIDIPPEMRDKFDVEALESMTPSKVIADITRHFMGYFRLLSRDEDVLSLFFNIIGRISDIKPEDDTSLSPEELRNIQGFMESDTWDEEKLLDLYNHEIAGFISDNSGMLNCNTVYFPKEGPLWAGVDYQYCPPTDEMSNCQIGVMLGYTSPIGGAPLDFSLYMPEKWFGPDFAEKRARCRVPDSLGYKTQTELLLEMIKKPDRSGAFKFKYLGLGENFPPTASLLEALPKGLVYFADAAPDLELLIALPGKGGRAELARTTVQRLASDQSAPWITDPDDPIPGEAQDKRLRVLLIENGKPGPEVWLYVMLLDGNPLMYALCNEPATAPVSDLRSPAVLRFNMGQTIYTCQTTLGLSDYDLRTYRGWKRHMIIVSLSDLYAYKQIKKYSI